jgi:integrase
MVADFINPDGEWKKEVALYPVKVYNKHLTSLKKKKKDTPIAALEELARKKAKLVVPVSDSLKKHVQQVMSEFDIEQGLLFPCLHHLSPGNLPISIQYANRFLKRVMTAKPEYHHLPFKSVGTHSFRRSFADKMIELGIQIVELKTLMGHQSIQTTSGYITANKQKLFRYSKVLGESIEAMI